MDNPNIDEDEFIVDLDIEKINEKRKRKNQPNVRLNPLLVNINGRRFRNDEINIKICDIYDMVDCDLDWTFPEIFDPWKRAKKHMELFSNTFGEGHLHQLRFDHFFEYTHVCDVYKWMNRAYQLLRPGGVFIATFVDFVHLFDKIVSAENSDMDSNERITLLQDVEKQIFTTSDSSGMYFHRTILTPERVKFYMNLSFFYDIEITKSYHEVIESDIYEVRAIKDSNKKVVLAPDGTLQEVLD